MSKNPLAVVDCSICNLVIPKNKAILQLYIEDYNEITNEVKISEIVLCRRCHAGFLFPYID